MTLRDFFAFSYRNTTTRGRTTREVEVGWFWVLCIIGVAIAVWC